MDMMFNTEMIVKDMKGGKEDMTERFIAIDDGLDFMVRDTIAGDDLIDADGVADVLNDYEKENEHLKQSHKEILRDLEVTTFDKELLQKEKEVLYKENKQLKMHMKSAKAYLEGGHTKKAIERLQIADR